MIRKQVIDTFPNGVIDESGLGDPEATGAYVSINGNDIGEEYRDAINASFNDTFSDGFI